jgi:glycerol kinase
VTAPQGLLLAIDQGTSATKAVLVDTQGRIVARASAPLAQAHPRPGWVEQSAEEIWRSVQDAVAACVADDDAASVTAVGLSSQRESLVLWERAGGAPLGPLLSWQDQRTAPHCARLRATGANDRVRALSGLPLDPMFSALKAAWLLDAHDPDRSRSRGGELCLGTVDSWLLSRLGEDHVIEVGNASRTQLLNVRARTWDPELLELFEIPEQVLPRVVPSTGPFPAVRDLPPLHDGTPVAAVMGDSHAALFAHAGWRPGYVKATYGTGSSIMSLGDPSSAASDSLCLTIAWDHGSPAYAFEGNIRATGGTLTWLAGLLNTTPAGLAESAAPSSEGVHLVPAFGGLGAPWWDDEAVGLLSGLSFGTRASHVARAALESIAFQVEDVVAAVEREVRPVEALLADGGPTANGTLMQLQADTSGRRVEVAPARDLSALGVAHLAALSGGVWSREDLEGIERGRDVYEPLEDARSRERRRGAWQGAVARARLRAPGALADDSGPRRTAGGCEKRPELDTAAACPS